MLQPQVEEPEQPVADLGPFPSVGVVDLHGLDAVEDLADAPGECDAMRSGAACRAQEHSRRMPRDDRELDADDAQPP